MHQGQSCRAACVTSMHKGCASVGPCPRRRAGNKISRDRSEYLLFGRHSSALRSSGSSMIACVLSYRQTTGRRNQMHGQSPMACQAAWNTGVDPAFNRAREECLSNSTYSLRYLRGISWRRSIPARVPSALQIILQSAYTTKAHTKQESAYNTPADRTASP
jgi:hypothetical protein